MTRLACDTVLAAMEATWPPAWTWTSGPFTCRDGAGGGKRVSAATAHGPVTQAEIAAAHLPLFCIRPGEDDLDTLLADQGYAIVDPVTLFAASVDRIIDPDLPPLAAISSQSPLAIQREIWAQGGIGDARLAVMLRAKGPRSFILGRAGDRPAGVAFAALSEGIVMVHAIETLPRFRRKGVGRSMLRRAAVWGSEHGAQHVALAVTTANVAANALYASLGMLPVGHYHYRMLPEPRSQ